jgi:hypothetical protein
MTKSACLRKVPACRDQSCEYPPNNSISETESTANASFAFTFVDPEHSHKHNFIWRSILATRRNTSIVARTLGPSKVKYRQMGNHIFFYRSELFEDLLMIVGVTPICPRPLILTRIWMFMSSFYLGVGSVLEQCCLYLLVCVLAGLFIHRIMLLVKGPRGFGSTIHDWYDETENQEQKPK